MAEATLDLAARDDGRFDALVWQLVDRRRLAFDEETVFECLLTLPDTEYTNSQRIAYFPGNRSSFLSFPFLVVRIENGPKRRPLIGRRASSL